VLRNDKTLYVTLINKEHGTSASPTAVKLQLPGGYKHAETMLLAAPGNDIGATSEITLGGASITGEGAWSGTWSKAKMGSHDATFVLPPSSAMIVKLIPGK
jgi:hypothetical protein